MLQQKKTLKDVVTKNLRVLMRVDFNVPIKEGKIEDDSRILASLPSIRYLLEENASIVLISHLGDPKGEKKSDLSLKPIAKRLEKLLGQPVKMAEDCVGSAVLSLCQNLKPKEILLLENLRFHEGEKKPEKDPDFAKNLSQLGQVYVNDAFGSAHRAHSSVTAVPKYFPGKACMGLLMEKEVKKMEELLDSPPHPFFALIGGVKISDKIAVLNKLSKKVDALFIGGAMAFTFLKKRGVEVGNSPVEDLKLIESIDEKKIHLPLDLVIASEFKNNAATKIVLTQEGLPKSWYGVDIGPKTIEAWSQKLSQGKIIFWNGPLGVYEMENFSKGTKEIAKALSQSKAKVFVGGGNSVSAIENTGLSNKFYHLSTGGGAALEFIEKESLPGIDSLSSL